MPWLGAGWSERRLPVQVLWTAPVELPFQQPDEGLVGRGVEVAAAVAPAAAAAEPGAYRLAADRRGPMSPRSDEGCGHSENDSPKEVP